MATHRFRLALALAAVIGALGLSACGRNGALGLPPGPAGAPPAAAASNAPPNSGFLPGPAGSPDTAAGPQETVAKTGFDARGNPAASQGEKKPFILDPLLR